MSGHLFWSEDREYIEGYRDAMQISKAIIALLSLDAEKDEIVNTFLEVAQKKSNNPQPAWFRALTRHCTLDFDELILDFTPTKDFVEAWLCGLTKGDKLLTKLTLEAMREDGLDFTKILNFTGALPNELLTILTENPQLITA